MDSEQTGKQSICTYWDNNINSQLDAKITNFIDNYNQLNMRTGQLLKNDSTPWNK